MNKNMDKQKRKLLQQVIATTLEGNQTQNATLRTRVDVCDMTNTV